MQKAENQMIFAFGKLSYGKTDTGFLLLSSLSADTANDILTVVFLFSQNIGPDMRRNVKSCFLELDNLHEMSDPILWMSCANIFNQHTRH